MKLGETLRKFRLDVGYSEKYVARRLGVSEETLQAIEADEEDIDAEAITIFSELYGIEPEKFWDGELDESTTDTMRLLFLRGRGVELPERTRAAIAKTFLVARQYQELGEMLGRPSSYERLRRYYRHEGEYQGLGEPWQKGEELALRVRQDLQLGDEPVRSIRRLAEDGLGILVINTNLRLKEIAACSFSNPRCGPVIVVNHAGANAGPWRWRFTVAHELCHVLFDELSQQELGSMTSYKDQEEGAEDAVEKRANSFAITLLAPKDPLRNHLTKNRKLPLASQLRALMEGWGINFKAARYRMLHLQWAEKNDLEAVSGVDTMESPGWMNAETVLLDSLFPCPSVPPERRGSFALRAVEAHLQGVVSRNRLVGLLEAAPDDPLDQLVALVDELRRR